MNWNKIRHAKWFIPVLVVLAVAMITGGVLAAAEWFSTRSGHWHYPQSHHASQTINFTIINAGSLWRHQLCHGCNHHHHWYSYCHQYWQCNQLGAPAVSGARMSQVVHYADGIAG